MTMGQTFAELDPQNYLASLARAEVLMMKGLTHVKVGTLNYLREPRVEHEYSNEVEPRDPQAKHHQLNRKVLQPHLRKGQSKFWPNWRALEN